MGDSLARFKAEIGSARPTAKLDLGAGKKKAPPGEPDGASIK